MKQRIVYMLLAMIVVATSCNKHEVSFTYSPKAPRAGQEIQFSNQTDEGEEWLWEFGDGTTSTSKSPKKTYKKPGSYPVILTVDDKKSRRFSATVVVLDTVPAIGLSDTIVYYYQPITLTAESYNPYSYDMTYAWHLPKGTLILEGDTTEDNLKVCFTQAENEIHIGCDITMDVNVFSLDTTIALVDVAARSIVVSKPNYLAYQRIYKYGVEPANQITPSDNNALLAPSTMCMTGDLLYIFNNDQSINGGIYKTNIATLNTQAIVKNAVAGSEQGFAHGSLYGNKIFWTAGDKIYQANTTDNNIAWTAGAADQLLAAATEVGYGLAAGQTSGGIMLYNDMYLYAYGQGLYRFAAEEIGGTAVAGAILTDQTISCFSVDPIARKIYFVAQDGLKVAGMDGQNIVVIDAQANGKSVVVDNADNLLVWTTNEGVNYMPLIQTANNTHNHEIKQLNNIGDITAITIDSTERLR